jgi:segregation and condensation protein B
MIALIGNGFAVATFRNHTGLPCFRTPCFSVLLQSVCVAFTDRSFFAMAFNLQKVLRALLFSSSQALSIRDVQDIFARFHEQAPAAAAGAATDETGADTGEEISPLTVLVADADADAGADASADAETNAGQPAGDSVGDLAAPVEATAEREPEPEPDPEAPSLKPAGLVSAQAAHVVQFTQAGEPAQDAQAEEPAQDAQAEEPAAQTEESAAQSEQSEQSEQPVQSAQPAADAPVEQPADGSGAQTEEAAEVPAQSSADTDAELYQSVPSLITAAQIREAMDAISAELRAADDIYILVEGPAGYRLMTHPRYARWIRIMRDEPPPVKLSQSALETLAVVAYRQPVTRSEIESIRGVSAEAGLGKLMERELVYITGRADLPGRPLQYGTTDKFLEFVGVKSLIELPASDVLSPRQIDAWLQNSTKVTPPSDAEMGLPLEEGEGESPNLASVSVDHTVTPFETAGKAAEEAPAEDAPMADAEAAHEAGALSDRTDQTDQTDQPDLSDQPTQPAPPPAPDALDAPAPETPAPEASPEKPE